jgi:putative SOS response-associated peptidase YedK
MCGRITLTVSNKDIEHHLRSNVDVSSIKINSTYPRYNISPGQPILSIIHDGQSLRAGEIEWGFIPSFATKGFKPLINARAETISQKPSFKESFQRRRCLIVCDGYYEWDRSGDQKQPYYIRKRSGISYIAGIYTAVILPNGDKKYTAAIITTNANDVLSSIHDRMPLFIEPECISDWLHEKPTLNNTNDSFTMHPVSSLVNSSKVDNNQLIQAL